MKKEIIDEIRKDLLRSYLEDYKNEILVLREKSSNFYLKGGDSRNEI